MQLDLDGFLAFLTWTIVVSISHRFFEIIMELLSMVCIGFSGGPA
jgi:hypothetical protein